MKINVYHVSKSTWISGWNNVMPSWVGGLYHTGVEVWGRCVVRDSNSGHQLLFTPAKWCHIFASRTTQGVLVRAQQDCWEW